MKFLKIGSVIVMTFLLGVPNLYAGELNEFTSPYALKGKVSSFFEPGKITFQRKEGGRTIHEARNAKGDRIAQLLIDSNGRNTFEAYEPGSLFPLVRESENDRGAKVTEVFDPKSKTPVIREIWTKKQSLSVEFFDENTGKLLGRCRSFIKSNDTQLIAELYDSKRPWMVTEKSVEKTTLKQKTCHDLLAERIRNSKNQNADLSTDIQNSVLSVSRLSLEALDPLSAIDRHPSVSDENKIKTASASEVKTKETQRKPSYSVIRIANE